MAPDLGDPPRFSRKYQEVIFPDETSTPVAPVEEDTSDAVDIGLTTMMSCVHMLMRARKNGRIDFAPGLTATMLEIMGVLLMRSAHVGNEPREALFRHWLEAGPSQTDELIEKVSAREGKLLMPEDLASMFMGKPPGY